VATQGDPLRSSLFHLMRLVLQEHQALWSARMAQAGEAGLTKPQYALLRAVGLRPGLDQSRVGEITGTDKATTAELVARLCRRGLLARTVDDLDRRRRLLHLTPAGRDLVQRLVPLTDQVDDVILQRITPGQRETLRELLALLRASRTEAT
jgi:MarR family transcriptional regulator, temperature-dependent positive regulator of motility